MAAIFHGSSFIVMISFVTALMTSSSAYDRRGLLEALRLARSSRNQCLDVAGQCFSAQQCCDGLVCAALNEYLEDKVEVPGACVKEKDLQSCKTSEECTDGTNCLPIGRFKEFYCLPRPVSQHPASKGFSRHMERVSSSGHRGTGGLGASCQQTSECKLFTTDGKDELCCKDVHRGRLGTKRLCDRVVTIGACISSRY